MNVPTYGYNLDLNNEKFIRSLSEASRRMLQFEQSTKNFGYSIKSIFAGIATAYVTNEVVNFGKKIIDTANKEVQALKLLENAYQGNTEAASSTIATVKDLAAKYGISSEQLIKYGQRVAQTGVGVEKTNEQIKWLAKYLAFSGVEGENASGIIEQLAQAAAKGKVELEDLKIIAERGGLVPGGPKDTQKIKALSDNIGKITQRIKDLELQKYKIEGIIKDANDKTLLSYKNQVNQLKNIDYEIKGLKITLKELNDQQKELDKGGFGTMSFEEFTTGINAKIFKSDAEIIEERQKSLAGSMAVLTETWNQFLLAIAGVENGKIVEGGFFDEVNKGVKEFTDWFKENKDTVKEFGKVLGTAFTTVTRVLRWFLENKEALIAVGTIIGSFGILAAISSIGGLITSLTALGPVAAPVLAIAGALSILGIGINQFIKEQGGFGNVIESIKNGILSFFSNPQDLISSAIDFGGKLILGIGQGAMSAISSLGGGILDGIKAMLGISKGGLGINLDLSTFTKPLGELIPDVNINYNINIENKFAGSYFANRDNIKELVNIIKEEIREAQYRGKDISNNLKAVNI